MLLMSCFGSKLMGMVHKPTPYFPDDIALFDGAPAAAAEAAPALLRSTTIKRLKPGNPGTRRLLQRYGANLLCVRYRVDRSTGKRFTTVELLIDERAGPPAAMVWLRVGYGETDLRRQIKEAGGVWDAQRKLWRISGQVVNALKLQKRIIENVQ